MIISRTPLRISFFGGGTDAVKFYKNVPDGWGSVLSTTIKNYVYIGISKIFEKRLRAYYYGVSEDVDNIENIKNQYIKEALKRAGINTGVDVFITTDSIEKGGGLGGSGSFIVGLLNTAYAFLGQSKMPSELEKEASELAIDVLKDTTGKQDQAAPAFGGLNVIKFFRNDKISVEQVNISKDTLNRLQNRIIQFHTGSMRKASNLLKKQETTITDEMYFRIKMRNQVEEGKKLLESGNLDKFGRLLNEAWELKKNMSGVSNPMIDKYYQDAVDAGAIGGKLSGAGSSGFLFFYCPEDAKESIRKALNSLKEIKVLFEPNGSKMIYDDKNG